MHIVATRLFGALVLALSLIACGDNGPGVPDASPQSCAPGRAMCDGVCADLDLDRNNCGGCGLTCEPGFVCDGSGGCELSCQAGLLNCDGTCINPKTDRTFCGATADCTGGNAGAVCHDGEICNGDGVCELSCQAGLLSCGGSCIDPQTSHAYCGATDCAGGDSGMACADAADCIEGTCVTCTPDIFTFEFTGAPQTFTVPPQVVAVVIDARGAQGAQGADLVNSGVGGLGGRAVGTMAVSEGDVLQVNVGGQDGFNGGGPGGTGSGLSGNGGGASDVRTGAFDLADRVIVAGGGGGGAAGTQQSCAYSSGGNGGDGGGPVGGTGGTGTDCSGDSSGGLGGTSSEGGSGGNGASYCLGQTVRGDGGGEGLGGGGGGGEDIVFRAAGFTASRSFAISRDEDRGDIGFRAAGSSREVGGEFGVRAASFTGGGGGTGGSGYFGGGGGGGGGGASAPGGPGVPGFAGGGGAGGGGGYFGGGGGGGGPGDAGGSCGGGGAGGGGGGGSSYTGDLTDASTEFGVRPGDGVVVITTVICPAP